MVPAREEHQRNGEGLGRGDGRHVAGLSRQVGSPHPIRPPCLLKVKHDKTDRIVSEVVKDYPDQDAGSTMLPPSIPPIHRASSLPGHGQLSLLQRSLWFRTLRQLARDRGICQGFASEIRLHHFPYLPHEQRGDCLSAT